MCLIVGISQHSTRTSTQELAEKYKPKLRENKILTRTAYSGAEEAKRAVMPYLKGALRIGGPADDEVAWFRSDKKNLLRVFAMIGQMGKGKTRLQYELCEQVAVKTDFGSTHVNFVRLTYNEGFQAEAIPGRTTTVFGQNLLMCTGMGLADAQRVRSLEEAIELLYRKLQWPDGKERALVVCVDEFLTLPAGEDGPEYPEAARANLLRELVQFQERTCRSLSEANRVVFMFAAVTEELVAAAAEPSGRQLCAHHVPTVDKERALSLLFELRPDLEPRYTGGEDPQFEQLVRLCLARPRALFNGILTAYPEGVGSVSMASALDVVAKSNSLNETLLYLTPEDVDSWLAERKTLSGDSEHRKKLERWGVTTADGVFDPLTLRVWCERKAASQVARHLREAYLADTNVERHHEKDVEVLLYNFEAAKRAAFNNKPFNLEEYYTGGWIEGGLETASVSAFPSEYTPEELVETVTSFKDEKAVSGFLRTGKIVVSAFENEPGIEYLVPFFTDKLCPRQQLQYVAAVQVKFSKNGNLKGGYPAICDRVMKLPIVDYLQKEENVTCFPVLFSAAEGDVATHGSQVECGVYNEAALFKFTERLGPLRLHRESIYSPDHNMTRR